MAFRDQGAVETELDKDILLLEQPDSPSGQNGNPSLRRDLVRFISHKNMKHWDPLTMTNIALNCAATQSSTSTWSINRAPGIDARTANNGDLISPAYFHTDKELYPWWQVDLGSIFDIDQITIYNRLDAPQRLRKFSLLRSYDGYNWLEFFKKTDDSIFAEFSTIISEICVARFVRVRLDGSDALHFRECQIFGRHLNSGDEQRFIAEDECLLRSRHTLPEGRSGHMSRIGEFYVFVDEENYDVNVRRALDEGRYEGRERKLVADFLLPDDRVIEVGTAVGVVSMTAASIVGPSSVVTFDANPDIVADAKENFRRNNLHEIKSNLGVLTCRNSFKAGTCIDFHVHKEFWASRLDAGAESPGIVKTVQVPMFCLEEEISAHNANVLICDIEGGEVNLLKDADLSGIRLIIIETHYWAAGEAATDAMIRDLVIQGFSLHLGASGGHVSVLRRS